MRSTEVQVLSETTRTIQRWMGMLHGMAAAVMGILLLPSEQSMVICAWHCWDDPVIATPDTLEAGG